MFTGIVQALGEVVSRAGESLSIRVPNDFVDDPIQIGESVAVNGCCLTVVRGEKVLEFDLSQETLSRTTFGDLDPGTRVNLERALRVGDRLGGHFVQGHVDVVGQLIGRTANEAGETFRFRIPENGATYLIDKGSIALDGISLTVVNPKGSEFDVAVIPHTLKETNLGGKAVGTKVHVEYDVLAKHIAKLLGKV